jgi:predicted nucleic acid-binding protein
MIVISNSSPLIALARVGSLYILKELFGNVFIPDSVYQEAVLETSITIQKESITKATNEFIEVVTPTINHTFIRKLGKGERGVLNLALEKLPNILLIDDKKARNEARDLGFEPSFTTDIIKKAAERKIIPSYEHILMELFKLNIYLPE